MQESQNEFRIAELSEIINNSRRVTGHAHLGDAELESTVEAWDELVRDIPGDRLRDSYLRAIKSRSIRGPLQPTELLDAWYAIASVDRLRRGPDTGDACGLCDSEGWQRFELACPTVGASRVVVRGCACSYAPPAERKSDPLRPPAWERSPSSGVWLPQTMAAILSKPCNCNLCKAAVASPTVDSKWTAFDPDYFAELLAGLQARGPAPEL